MKTRNGFAVLLVVFVYTLFGWSACSLAESEGHGIDVSGFVNGGYLGFLSLAPVQPAGQIVSTEVNRIMMSQGDLVKVGIVSDHNARVGDLLTVCRVALLKRDSSKGKGAAYVVSFLGRVLLKEAIKPALFRAQVTDSYRPIRVGDLVLPFEPVSSCIKPVPVQGDLQAAIAANQEMREVAGQHSVVYLPIGYEQGMRRGNIFEIVRKRRAKSAASAPLSETAMGYMLVVETRPNTTTGLVLTTKEEFYPREAYVRGVEWEKAREIFSTLPSCKLE